MAGDVKVRITGEDKGAQDTIKRTERALDDLAESSERANKSNLFDKMSSAAFKFNNVVDALKNTWGQVSQVIDATVGEFSNYATEVEKFSRATGMSADEASRLIQTADDFQVEIGSLEQAMKLGLQNGFNPTIDNIAQLADEFNAIQDPIARAELMQKKFGRSWQDLLPLLEAGGDAIRQTADGVSDSLIVTAEAVEQNKKYKKACDDLEDAVSGVKNEIGKALIPVLTDAAQATYLLMTRHEQLKAVLSDHSKDVVVSAQSYEEYTKEMIRAAEAAGYGYDVHTNRLYQGRAIVQQNYLLTESEYALAQAEQKTAEATESVILPVQDLTAATDSHSASIMAMNGYYQASEGAISGATKALQTQKEQLDVVLGSTQALTAEILYQKMVQGLNAEAALELGRSMGVINELSYTMQSELQKLREKFDTNRDGIIQASEATGEYQQKLLEFAGTWNALQDKDISLTVHISEIGGAAGIGAQERNYGVDLNGNGIIGAKYGADFDVPDQPRYANDGMLMRVSAGEHVTVTPANQAQGGSKPGGNTNIFYIFTKDNPGTLRNGLTLSAMMGGAA